MGNLACLRRFASGGMSGVPGGIDQQLTPPTGRTYVPLNKESDYFSYGEGPEHQFFTGELPKAPMTGSSGAPPGNIPISSPGGRTNWGDIITEIPQLGKTAALAGDVLQGMGFDNAFTQGLSHYGSMASNPLGAAHGALMNAGIIAPSMADFASGAAGNAALSGAGFTGDIGATASQGFADILGGGAGAGTGAAGTGALSAETLAPVTTSVAPITEAGTAAAGSEAAGAGAAGVSPAVGAASAFAVPLIGALMTLGDIKQFNSNDLEKMALANIAQHGYGYGSPQSGSDQAKQWASLPANVKQRLLAAQQGLQGWASSELQNEAKTGHFYDPAQGRPTIATPRTQTTYRSARGGPTHGHLGNMLVDHFTRGSNYVTGPGDGRSDSIPARLSNGEYVMDAETVSMLGDGSSDAGARKLDQLRENLRKHKGRKLSRGKFSDNAKDPASYLEGN